MTARSPGTADRGDTRLGVLWAAVAIGLPALLVSFAPISTVDLAYGIRAGSIFLDGGGIARTDTFTFTAAGLPWLNQQWLGQVIFAAVYRVGGWPALATFWAIVVGSIEALLWRAARALGADARSAGLALLLGFVVAAQGIGLRAQVLGLLCLAGLIAVVGDRGRHPRGLWLSVPILVAWANVHGSFPVGLVLLGLTAAEDIEARRAIKMQVAVFITAAAGTLANPFGIDAWRYVAAIGTDPTIGQFVVEWRHASLLDSAGAAFFASVLAVGVLAAATVRLGCRPPWATLAWLAGVAVLGTWAIRAIAWWGIGASPFVATLLAAVTAGSGRSRASAKPAAAGASTTASNQPGPWRAGSRVPIAMAAILGILAVGVQPIWRSVPDGGGIGSRLEDAPAGIAAAVRDAAADRPGVRVFNAQRWGSWLELAVPGAALFADSRVEVIPVAAWTDYVLVSEANARWSGILDAWGVDLMVVSAGDQPSLARAIRADAGWQVAHEDSDGLVAVRSTH